MRLSTTDKGKVLEHTKVAKQMDELMFKRHEPEEKLLFRRLLLQMQENLKEEKELSGLDRHDGICRKGDIMKKLFKYMGMY